MGVKFSVCALIVNKDHKLLAVSRKDNRNDWGLPGGKVEPGEPIVVALQREVEEETGLKITKAEFVFGNLSESKGYYCYTYFCEVDDLSTLHTPEKVKELGEGDIKWCDWEDIETGHFGSYNRHLHYVFIKMAEDWATLTLAGHKVHEDSINLFL